MADYRYTDAQREAIEYRGGNVLVSAAAGSGKTSVLSKRVSCLVEEGTDIRKILVVTFTQKAAQEMKKRIRTELSDAAESKNDPMIAIQAELTESSDICTIHSFAQKIIRENFTLLDLPSDMHAVSDDTLNVYRSEAYDTVFEYFYENDDVHFLRFRDRYSKRDEKELIEILGKAYAYVKSQPEGVDWIKDKKNLDTVRFVDIEKERIRNELVRALNILEETHELSVNESFPEIQIQNDENDIIYVKKLIELLDAEDIAGFNKTLESYKIPSVFKNKKDEQSSPEKLKLQDMKRKARGILSSVKENDLITLKTELETEIPYIETTVSDLFHILKKYDEVYSSIKREHHVIDYDDMLHFAYELLSKKEVSEKYSRYYEYVFIDEYQDTNPLQEALLNSIEPSGGRFMVGDMKQSIYRFRLTDPTIFRNKTIRNDDIHLIKMNDNFRCERQIIDFVNHCMGNIMCNELGEITYDEEEKLIAPKDKELHEDNVEIMISKTDKRNAALDAEREAHNIADRIWLLLSEKDENGNRMYSQEDICILMRKFDYAPVYTSVLQNAGIDVRLTSGKDDPVANEIFLNLLRVINGYTSDIALLSVMKSFVGDFDENDFARIRGEGKDSSFSESFLRYTAFDNELGERCREFHNRISRYRSWEKMMPLEDLLIRLKNAEDFDSYIYLFPNGTEKKGIFDVFFQELLALAVDKSSLYELLYYVDKIKDNNRNKSRTAESVGSVQIMTIHSAKGLEFPVVILARADGGFSDKDKNSSFFFHNDLGITMDMVDEKQRIKIRSKAREIGKYVQDKEQLSEELRVLYVAMTRAKNKLIISGTVDDMDKIIRTFTIAPAWEV